MSNLEKFSSRLLNLRLRLGLTQAELAPRLNCSRNYLNMLEGGREPGVKFRRAFDLFEQRHTGEGASSALLREEPARYHAGPQVNALTTLLHQCEALLVSIHDAQTLAERRFAASAFERAWQRFKDEALFSRDSLKDSTVRTAPCAPTRTNAASSTTAQPSSRPPTETANIVKLPRQHLTSKPSSAAQHKTRHA